MAIYSMACPKCGKRATEYDENKWQCLQCGIKFIYKNEAASYQTNISIAGSTLFDLDPNTATHHLSYEVPYLSRHDWERDEEIVKAKVRRDEPLKWGLILLAPCIFFGCMAKNILPVIIMLFGVPSVVCLIVGYNRYERRGNIISARQKYLSSMMERIGSIVLCPYCKKEHTQLYISPPPLPTAPQVKHLDHCKHCGKQFYMDRICSYQLVKAGNIQLPQPPPRFCTSCGKSIPEGDRFCVSCGTPVSTTH
jgi:predicted nucleic acid-binding Zn ribbon protein